MKRGFTLLELIIVIIIIGVLATLGFTQYSRLIEKARGAEPKGILGDLRKLAAAYRLERGSFTGITNVDVGIGTNPGDVPLLCVGSHYFMYSQSCISATDTCVFTATRCTASGKEPQGPAMGQTMTLTSNYVTGSDTWGGTGGY